MGRLGPALVLALLVPAAPATALDRYVPMKAAPGPGPAQYDSRFLRTVVPFLKRNAR